MPLYKSPYPPLLTAIPATGADGAEFCYVADSTNGNIWTFRYRSASASAYKWEFIGGSALFSEVLTDENTGVGVYGDLTTVGPSVTLPLAGDYDVAIGAGWSQGADNGVGFMSYQIGGTAAVDTDSIQFTRGTGSIFTPGARTRRKTGLTAVALTAKYKNGIAGVANFRQRWMSAIPVRVG